MIDDFGYQNLPLRRSVFGGEIVFGAIENFGFGSLNGMMMSITAVHLDENSWYDQFWHFVSTKACS